MKFAPKLRIAAWWTQCRAALTSIRPGPTKQTKMRPYTALITLCTAAVGLSIASCALLTPLPRKVSLPERLAAMPVNDLPLERRVRIHWNEHQIPFIEAETDNDAAFALGLVHAHLRLGQMEAFRRIAHGRIAEMVGPLATDIDHGLRILNFAHRVTEIESSLPPATRAWLENFVTGINHYQRTTKALPVEFKLLGLEREPWSVADILTFGRLAGTDVNWLVWFGVLELRKRPDWPEIWTRLVEHGTASLPSFEGQGDVAALNSLLAGLSRSGSNSLAIAPDRTKTGAAIMANDPHLGITVPNVWIIAGLKSPSYHAVGLMAPGLPIFAIGRNPWISWGGTNMRAASSDLVDLSDVASTEITPRRETIAVRWWFDQQVTVRDTRWGPILSDAPQLADYGGPNIALRWTGHQISDEMTAMLDVSRARNFVAFRESFQRFAVPGQNMLYADNVGNIGQVMAVRLPERSTTAPADILVDRQTVDKSWRNLLGVRDLPFSYNPKAGYLFSANNRPTETKIPVGYFFSPDDRVVRLRDIMKRTGRIAIDDVKAIQQDAVMPSSVSLRDFYLQKLEPLAASAPADQHRAIELMRAWDGNYGIESRGAVAFELFHQAFTSTFYAGYLGAENAAQYAGAARRSLIPDDVGRADVAPVTEALLEALAHTATRLDGFANWGEMHRLRLAHPLANLPLIGGRYVFADHPAAGSSHTLMKTAHGTTSERHNTRYGSNARHISDLSDIDRNYFVLLGGQDGWINSSTFLDQVGLWRNGGYVQVPLRLETVNAWFTHTMELTP